jgi:hypothetical protein
MDSSSSSSSLKNQIIIKIKPFLTPYVSMFALFYFILFYFALLCFLFCFVFCFFLFFFSGRDYIRCQLDKQQAGRRGLVGARAERRQRQARARCCGHQPASQRRKRDYAHCGAARGDGADRASRRWRDRQRSTTDWIIVLGGAVPWSCGSQLVRVQRNLCRFSRRRRALGRVRRPHEQRDHIRVCWRWASA